MLYVAAVYVVYVECQADFVEGSNLERCYYNDADKKTTTDNRNLRQLEKDSSEWNNQTDSTWPQKNRTMDRSTVAFTRHL